MNPTDLPYQADIFVTADQLPALNQLAQLLRRDTAYPTLVRDMGGGTHALLVGCETEIDADVLFTASAEAGLPADHWKFQRMINPQS